MFSPVGEGNGNLLQCSCLENPRDGGAWWTAVYGVTQSQTRLKRHSSSSSILSCGMQLLTVSKNFLLEIELLLSNVIFEQQRNRFSLIVKVSLNSPLIFHFSVLSLSS